MSRPWYSAIWAATAVPGWPLPVTRMQLENKFYGECLVNAQGEDVVAGIRTPAPVNEYSKNAQSEHFTTLEKLMPALYKELYGYQKKLEQHYRDMQDIEFTIEKGTLYMLQCRVGKRNGVAAVRMATEMFKEKLIDAKTAVQRRWHPTSWWNCCCPCWILKLNLLHR